MGKPKKYNGSHGKFNIVLEEQVDELCKSSNNQE